MSFESGPELWSLRDLLAAHYRRSAESREILSKAGVDLTRVNLEASPRDAWTEALGVAERAAKLEALVGAVLADRGVTAIHAQVRGLWQTLSSVPQAVGGSTSNLDGLLEPGRYPTPEDPSPAALLDARYSPVPFFGRAALREELDEWAHGADPASGALLYAAGGMGKTRLLAEVCADLRAKGWRAGFLPSDRGADDLRRLAEAPAKTLVVIDYAESRPDLSELLRVLVVSRTRAYPLRFVLLARNADDWWRDARKRIPQLDALFSRWVRAIPSAFESVEERQRAFRAAIRVLAPHTPQGFATPPLEDTLYDRVVYVHMAALLTVSGAVFTPGTLLGCVLDHEERFWQTRVETKDDAEFAEQVSRIRRVMGAITLRGPVVRTEAERIVMRLAPDIRALTPALHRLYPGGSTAHVDALRPNVLGEALVTRALDQGDMDALDAALEGAAGAVVTNALVVLSRAQESTGVRTGDWLRRVVDGDVAGRALAAFAAAKLVGEHTAHGELGLVLAEALKRRGTITEARALDAAGLPEETLSLGEVACWVWERIAQAAATKEERERALANAASWQMRLLRWPDALASASEAVRLFRSRALRRSVLGSPARLVAGVTVALLAALAFLGSPQAGLIVASLGALAILSTADVSSPYAARILTNLGIVLRNIGRSDEALDLLDEARSMLEQHPEVSRWDIASNLREQGATQRVLGQREKALSSTNEAVRIYFELAPTPSDEVPDGFLEAIGNLARIHWELGQSEEALLAARTAVCRYQVLAKRRPDVFLPALAAGLNRLGIYQSDLGQREDALASKREAVRLYGELAKLRPRVFLPDLAASLNNLGNVQRDLGQREDALASTREAVGLYRELVRQRPDAFLPHLATSLGALSSVLAAAGALPAARDAALEGLDLLWSLYERLPAAHAALATALTRDALRFHTALAEQPPPRLRDRAAALGL